MNQKPIVLFPYGSLPGLDRREECLSLIVSAGGDVQRVFDGPWGREPGSEESEQKFLKCVSRLNEVVSGSAPPYLVLTRVYPLPLAVLAKRRRFCGLFPNLKKGLWILYVDPVNEPFFFNDAKTLGSFDLDPNPSSKQHPLVAWYPSEELQSSRGEMYAVMTPGTIVDKRFKERIATMRDELSSLPAESQTYTRLRAIGLDLEPPLSSRRR